MTNPIQEILLKAGLEASQFSASSRYSGLAIQTIEMDGETIAYVSRRFLPPAGNFETLREHTVTEGERLDNITAQYLTDPELFWRLCDANNAMHPLELERVGNRIRITLPAGVPGGVSR